MKNQFFSPRQMVRLSWAMLFLAFASCDLNDDFAEPQFADQTDLGINPLTFASNVIPFDGTLYNKCCRDEIRVSGAVKAVVTARIIYFSITNFNVKGLTNGTQYFQSGFTSGVQVTYSKRYDGTVDLWLHLQGIDGCKFAVRLPVRTVLATSGDLSAKVLDPNIICK